MNELVLGDDLGPRGRRRVAIATMVSLVVIALVVFLAVKRFNDKGQLDRKLWKSIFTRSTAKFMFTGLRNTLTVSLVAMAIALLLGMLGSFGRLNPRRSVRIPSIALIELFRATPLVLLIYFAGVHVPGERCVWCEIPDVGVRSRRYHCRVLRLVSALFSRAVPHQHPRHQPGFRV